LFARQRSFQKVIAHSKGMEIKNQVVFIISYEDWGNMLMSKHHYAIELTKRGNLVYFINHPDRIRKLKRGEIRVENTNVKNLFSIRHRLPHPYFLIFKMRWLYEFLTKYHIRRLKKKIGKVPDLVWSFDSGNTIPLKFFPEASYRIYMPVDGPFFVPEEIFSAEKADIIFSVTKDILSRYDQIPAPGFLLSHGVGTAFVKNGPIGKINSNPIRVGYAGSLLRDDLDMAILRKIILAHPAIMFEFWGENVPGASSIHREHDVSEENKSFLNFLKSSPNVITHGAVNPETLAEGLSRMDVLLIAYQVKDAQNSHKVLEYLGSGKVIVSTYLGAYSDKPNLLEMVALGEGQQAFADLFERVVAQLELYNSVENQTFRINYARQFTYSSQVEKIERLISENIEKK